MAMTSRAPYGLSSKPSSRDEERKIMKAMRSQDEYSAMCTLRNAVALQQLYADASRTLICARSQVPSISNRPTHEKRNILIQVTWPTHQWSTDNWALTTGPTPQHKTGSSEPFTIATAIPQDYSNLRTFGSDSDATALASIVFPFPGGPKRRSPKGRNWA
uniref:Uncharacterized protein n=1 Tax=Oryza glumipatula TaxID=40148 RepID=A0A0E0A4H4_9ORYZ